MAIAESKNIVNLEWVVFSTEIHLVKIQDYMHSYLPKCHLVLVFKTAHSRNKNQKNLLLLELFWGT